jgi:hypothetical protein
VVVIVGGAEVTRSYDPSGAYASLRAAGMDWEYGGEGSGPPEPMPPTVSIGYWLLTTAKPAGNHRGQGCFTVRRVRRVSAGVR